MIFAEQKLLLLMFLIPIGIFFLYQNKKNIEKKLSNLVNPILFNKLIPSYKPSGQTRSGWIQLIAWFFLILALARPQWGLKEETVKLSGFDLMVVLDVSNSMLSEDVSPSRLLKAKQLIRSISQKIRGDRMGLIPFAGSAYIASPLTTDLDYLMEMVNLVGPKFIANQGTDLAVALKSAMQALTRAGEDTDKNSHSILLISDGEDFGEETQKAIDAIVEKGVKVFVVGVGTEKGGPIPVRDENGELKGYKRDQKGGTIMTHFNAAALLKLAEKSSGKYWNLVDAEAIAEELTQDLAGMDHTSLSEKKIVRHEDRYQWPLAVALLFFIVDGLFAIHRTRHHSKQLKKGIVMLLFFAFYPQAFASSIQSYRENEKGIKSLEAGKTEEAEKHFENAKKSGSETSILEFNQGVASLQKGDLDHAIENFEKAKKNSNSSLKLGAYADFNQGVSFQTKKNENDQSPATSNFKEQALSSYLSALDQAKKIKDKELESKIRKNIELLNKQMEQDQKKNNEDQDKENQDKKDQNKDGKNDPNQKSESGKNPEQSKNEKKNQKGQFKSDKLTKEDAEKVMNELSNQDKKLQDKLKKQGGNSGDAQTKDW